MVMKLNRLGFRMAVRKSRCWSRSRARRVGPGWLRHMISQSWLKLQCATFKDSLEELGVCRMLEVLQVAEVGHEVWLVEHVLLGQVIEIGGIGKALDELKGGQCQVTDHGGMDRGRVWTDL